MDKIQEVLLKVGRKDLAQEYFEKVALLNKSDEKKLKTYFENIKNISSDGLKNFNKGVETSGFILEALKKIESNVASIRKVAKDNKIKASKSYTSTTLKDFKNSKKGIFIPKGTQVEVTYKDNGRFHILNLKTKDGITMATLAQNASKTLRGFIKEPSLSMLEKWDSEGYSKSLLGKKVEPDGYDSNGMPSWLLVMGMI